MKTHFLSINKGGVKTKESLTLLLFSFVVVILSSCEKDNFNTVNNTNLKSQNGKFSDEKIKEIAADYNAFTKEKTANKKFLSLIPLQQTVSTLELLLNSKHGIKYQDRDYTNWELDTFYFELPFSDIQNSLFFSLNSIFNTVSEFDQIISDLNLPTDRIPIIVDVEPIQTLQNTVKYSLIVVNALDRPGLSLRNAEDYFEYNWKWGWGPNGGTFGKSWGCYPDETNPRTSELAGACGVLDLNLEEHYKADFPEACFGTFGYNNQLVTVNPRRPETYKYYQPYNGPLFWYTVDFINTCVNGDELRDYWFPTVKNIIEAESTIKPNPYRLSYGASGYMDFYAVRNPGGSINYPSQAMAINVDFEDPVCLQLLDI